MHGQRPVPLKMGSSALSRRRVDLKCKKIGSLDDASDLNAKRGYNHKSCVCVRNSSHAPNEPGLEVEPLHRLPNLEIAR